VLRAAVPNWEEEVPTPYVFQRVCKPLRMCDLQNSHFQECARLCESES